MIDADKRKAIYLLRTEGMGVREISRRLAVSRNTVAAIIAQQGAMPQSRRPKQQINEALLRRLYQQCEGYAQRVHERLTEEEGIEVSYPTLTRMLRDAGISSPPKVRCQRVPDEPGVEMQHDTTVYRVRLGEKSVRLIASLLYLRYSKRRYLKFYPRFNRFAMKCFLHEALMYWGRAAPECIIDNTNLARLRGTGSAAVIVPEMERFARRHGFGFRCHAIGHANRKAGEERSFWTVETNFLPGRRFASLEDLNQQALEWATVRMEHRPQGKAGLIPAQAFEFEREQLVALPAHLPAPCRAHPRGVDQYGYVAFAANSYWVPGTERTDVKLIEYADRIKIFRARALLAEYRLPPEGVRHQWFSPPGAHPPRRRGSRRAPTEQEEKRLRAMGEVLCAYLDFVLAPKGIERHGLIRRLYALSGKLTDAVFIASVERAHKYRIADVATIERIAALQLAEGLAAPPCVEIDEAFREREAYREGRLTDLPELSIHEPIEEEPEHE